MSPQAKLRVILQDHEIHKLDLPEGIPDTVDELESIVREKFGLNGNFTLHYKDAEFGEEYFSLTSTSDIKDKDTIKVVHIAEPPTVTLTFTDGDSSFENASVTSLSNSETSAHPVCSGCSSGSQDTLILSSPEHVNQRTQRWPTHFPVPNFAYNTELVLASGNEDFKKDGIQLNFVTILPDVLEKLAESIFLYVAYPTSAQLADVAEALIQKHPCLKEPGSYNGCYAWQQRLKYKMASYRSKLRGLGCPELDVNSSKKKRTHEKAPAKNIKKPKRAEVNYLPPHPQGETEGTLEHVRLELLDEVKKRNNCQVISEKMVKTFSIRRQEVVNQAPPISDFRDRWPALFNATQINEEFRRITTVGLETTFMAKLDQYTPKIMALVSSRGGAAKVKIQHIKSMLLEEQSVELRREAAIRSLIVYLREQEEDLFKEQLDGDEAMRIIVSRGPFQPASATVVIEGAEVLDGLTVPRACALLMGLMYALNLSYPKELKSTFENPDQRLQGQAEAKGRVSYSSVLINIGKCLLLIIIIPPFLNYASLQREGQMLLPKGGQIVDVGLGQKMLLLCKGRGSPVVILDAPTGKSSDIWFHVQESVSTLTTVCTYDRMGLGFSKRLMQNETTGTEKVWGMSTTGRMVDDLYRLLEAAGIAKPFILVGSELGALNGRFYSHIHDVQVSDLVLIDPIPEDVFEEDQWKEYWYGKLLPSLQARQFSAATGLSRMLIILGAIEPTIKGQNVSEEVIQRQKYLLSNPAHQSSAVDEHFFLNESAAQVRDITKFKPLSSRTSVSVLTGDSFDEQLPEHLNQMVAKLQKRFLKESYPSANHIHIKGADRRMIYKKPSAISQHLRKLVNQRQAKQQSE